MSAILFIPAGSVKFWNAWLFMGVLFIPMLFVIIYLKFVTLKFSISG